MTTHLNLRPIVLLVFSWMLLISSSSLWAQKTELADKRADFQQFIQKELQPRLAQVLFDPEVAPDPASFISFSKEIKMEMDTFWKEKGTGLSEEERQVFKADIQSVFVQLGQLYLNRAETLKNKERVSFFEQFLVENSLLSEVETLSSDLSRSLVMGVHQSLMIPFGGPNHEIEAYILEQEEPIRELLFAAFANTEIDMLSEGYESGERQFSAFSSDYPKSRFLGQLEKSLKSIEKLKTGQAVENFEFTDLDGNTVSLSDFKDKIIYLDFWATWCGPCISTFKNKTPAFEKQLDGNENIVLMYISVDEKSESWKNYLEKNPMKGVHLFAGKGFEADIMKYFKVWGIPRYLILDRGNTIHHVNAPRPGKEALEALNSILE
ncbi:TlpA family protein disulfide reductase [Indibacter alkaliphilus]|nr:TlpA disulfide reductase family protein [Indibacter alkaliphilus]